MEWDKEESFQTVWRSLYCENMDTELDSSVNERQRAATVVPEWCLAQFYFKWPDQARLYFHEATVYSGLQVEVTVAVCKQTEYQQESKSQMVVRATSVKKLQSKDTSDWTRAGILLEKVKFDDEKENIVSWLSILDQAIFLSLCLDVKNNNPADGLTG